MDWHLWHLFLSHPITHGAITGLTGAAVVDVAAFRTWNSWHDAESYNWGIASWRWLQGLVVGALSAAGLFGLGI